jgi:hypothetical protein
MEIMYGKSGRLTKAQRAGIWLAWGGAFGLEGVPMLWDVVDRVEVFTDNKGFLKKEVREGIANAANVFGEAVDAPEELVQFLATLADRGAISAFTDDQVALAHRASVAAVTPRFIESMYVVDLLGPGVSTLMGVMSGTVKTIDDLIVMRDQGLLNDPEQYARSIGLNYNRFAAVRNLALATGVDDAFIDKRGNKLVDEMTGWQKMQLALGLRPYELIKRSEERFSGYERAAQQKELIQSAVEKTVRLKAEYRVPVAIGVVEGLIEDGQPAAAIEYMNKVMTSIIANEIGAEHKDLLLQMDLMKRGIE